MKISITDIFVTNFCTILHLIQINCMKSIYIMPKRISLLLEVKIFIYKKAHHLILEI